MQARNAEDLIDAAHDLLERGYTVIPVRAGEKKPAVKWKKYQEVPPEAEDIDRWWGQWPDASIGIITGEVSGVVVVDIDSPEAQAYCEEIGLHSPIQSRTRRGRHMWFAHPRNGEIFGPRVGNNPSKDWPSVPGLDFRGDGSYVLVAPSNGYEWEIPYPLTLDDDLPIWKGLPEKGPESDQTAKVYDISTGMEFGDLDLSSVEIYRASVWEEVEAKVASDGLIQEGGRNALLTRYISEQVIAGLRGDALIDKGEEFMECFFQYPLPRQELMTCVASVERMEKANHPERYEKKVEPPKKIIRLLTEDDADDLISSTRGISYHARPWLYPGTITQLHGYSGSGKSIFLQHLLYAVACGCDSFGPYPLQKARVLYMDYENGRSVLGRRLNMLKATHGRSSGRFKVWGSFLETDKATGLNTRDGLDMLAKHIRAERPDVLVIDTVRSAFPGLEENSADAWSSVNSLAMKLRDTGLAVILVHHSNKPGEKLGREAGSTNQLTVLDTQIRVTQVYEKKELAEQNSGLLDEKLDLRPYLSLKSILEPGFKMDMVLEMRYGKVREWSDEHEWAQYVGLASDGFGNHRVVGSKSPVLVAQGLHDSGKSVDEIADQLQRSTGVIRDWLRS